MAVKPCTFNISNQGVCVVTWADLDQGDTGQPVLLGVYADKTIQCVGSGAVPIEGSNDGTNWAALTDYGGVAIVLDGSPEIAAIRENPLYIRPGTVTTADDNTVILVAKATGR